MPWDHCDVEFILDDEPCPRCGVEKARWTVQVDRTRTLRIGRRAAARWERTSARAGEAVRALAEGLPADGPVVVRVWEHDVEGAHDLVDELPAEARGGRVEAAWIARWVDDDDDWGARYELLGEAWSGPEYFFEVTGVGAHVRSGHEPERLLRLAAAIDEAYVGPDGAPLAGAAFSITLADGSTREGALDGQGRLLLDDAILGPFVVHVEPPPPPVASPPAVDPWSYEADP
ncbi:MAG: hypothetical protein M9894_31225 [Planctomycetes bacterium]|nr:hypothetical protein [Planctomycetota bacterium]